PSVARPRRWAPAPSFSSRAPWRVASRTSAIQRRACSTGACLVDKTTTSQRSPHSPPAMASPARKLWREVRSSTRPSLPRTELQAGQPAFRKQMTEEDRNMTHHEGTLTEDTRTDHRQSSDSALLQRTSLATDFAERVRLNQQKLTSALQPQYDFIVCGSGSSGSVVARRLAENPTVNGLLLEAGGSDEVLEVMEAGKWPMNLGSERDWNFQAQPNPHLNGRSIPLDMGKVLGGGSSINVMVWARGHKSDWDFFAAEAGDRGWS